MRAETPEQLTPPETTETLPPSAAEPPAAPASRGRSRGVWGLRARILFWSVATLALSITMAVVAVRQVLLVQIDGRIDEALAQEAEELRILANGRDPATGQSFGNDVARIFEVFLSRNVPQRNETYLTFIPDRRPQRAHARPAYRLDQDQPFVERVHDVSSTVRSAYETPVGLVEYLAVPVRAGGGATGVFVAAYFRDLETAEVDPATRAAAEVGLITLLIGSLVAWRVAEGVLRPLRVTTETARDISTADLSRRIPVTGRDEMAELGRTFNELLDKLEDAFETQRRFVDDAGHELRTPITIVRGHLELLDHDEHPEDRARTLALVQDELDRMQRIVTDLLTLAKAERPDFLAFDTLDLAQLTEELDGKVRALADRDWRLEGVGRGIVVADRQRLSQAMIQLAQNAVQHTPPGGEIAIGSDVSHGEARLWVRDAGEGIAPADLERIFDRFARGGRRRASDGAGIGLSIVKAIADAHGGRIEVDSALGRGSTFMLVVPVDQPQDQGAEVS